MWAKRDELSDVKDAESMRDLLANTFPFVIFFVEIDLENCLGSHEGESKLRMSYTSLRCFPPYMYTKLSSVFMVIPSHAMLFINQINSKIVDGILDLQNNGVTINDNQYFLDLLGELAAIWDSTKYLVFCADLQLIISVVLQSSSQPVSNYDKVRFFVLKKSAELWWIYSNQWQIVKRYSFWIWI